MNAVLYIHGKGGSAEESAHYRPLFPDHDVIGLDYRTFTPWETGKEIWAAVEKLKAGHEQVILIANSIGAFFSLHAGIDGLIERAYFISPVVDMERLIGGMMQGAGVTEADLRNRGVIPTAFGEDLSWEYLCYVRSHPIAWNAPTFILYGGGDQLTPRDAIRAFAEKHGASLTVLENGEHWFRTAEQMRFLDGWIRRSEQGSQRGTVLNDSVTIRSERISPEEYVDFLKRTDLGSQYPKERFRERIERLVNAVSISLIARNEENRVVGALFGLTDFSYWLYVTDLGVDRAYARRGIGRRLMKTAHELAGGEKDIAVYLIAHENAVPFYEKLGMERADDVMRYNHIEWTEFTVE